MLQKLVMNMLAIASKNRTATDQPAKNRKRSVENGQAKRNDRNGNGHNGRGFLSAVERERAQQETDIEAAGIAEKDGSGIKVVAQKSNDRAGQRDGHHFHEGGPVKQGNHECDHG